MAPDLLTFQIFLKILLAVFLGAVIGLEREFHGKAAGLRTYALVSLGACLFTVASLYGFREFIGSTSFDPSRIASQVAVGIGFIGAGIIFLRGDIVYGLTTAAGLWISAALGLMVGVSLYLPAVFAAVIALIVLTVLKSLEKYIHRGSPEDAQHDVL